MGDTLSYLQRTTAQLKKKFPLWHDNLTSAEFKKWPKAELIKFHTFVASNLESKPGDPADLQKFKKTLISCTLAHGTPTHYVTTSWNDRSVWDLHRPQILPYQEDTTQSTSSGQRHQLYSAASQFTVDEDQMKSSGPELHPRTPDPLTCAKC